jgi:pantoate--beta-alanine ligase
MELLTTPADMRAWSRSQRLAGHRLGLVPTMGALHSGHLKLIDEARGHCDRVIVSIFVNPLQFNRPDDFAGYPRPIDDDLAQCRAAGVDAVYAPTAAAMYPPGFETHVVPGPLAEPLEGAGRQGHFQGVTTVVTKLFTAATPDVAVFGQKDFQQLAIIRRMNTDLDLGIEIVGMATVREADGLAMSSRNRRLAPDDRLAAVVVPRALRLVERLVQDGERDVSVLIAAASAYIADQPRARLEYLRINDCDSLAEVTHIVEPVVVSTAVWFSDVRLIDNVVVDISPPAPTR